MTIESSPSLFDVTPFETLAGDDRPPLLPVRHPNQDLFICDVLDAIPKDDMASMEHPVFSLSTKPDNRMRRYEHNGNIIEIIPSGRGLATIHDKDILIYCISQLVAKMNLGEQPSRTVRLQAYDMLVATNRQTSGEGYRLMADALTRLRGTTVRTNIQTGGVEETRIFGLIEEARITRKTFDGRMLDLEITLSDWVYRSVISKNVLTLHRDYFRLRKPFERRMYELARKHCGVKDEWKIGLELLQKKCGSNSPLRVFRALVKKVCVHDADHGHFPDYAVTIADDVILFRNRSGLKSKPEQVAITDDAPYIDPETMHDAKTAAPGYDVYALYDEWVSWWLDMGKPELKSPAGAFLGFCKKRHERKPLR
ncbi:replication initiator protein A [Asaia sp. As-1742]|uniref:replication initiator protein A n=1 Tax=Asaia sp. As-1742 TaxID=2608325 RepID=UPI001421EA62|nr:replication initiator protein A [Asaia sp. As-1742]NIE81655.1 replication initiator protein A [Asaia sp. As-1742]